MNDEQFKSISALDRVVFDALETGDVSTAIEMQEAAGQRAMVNGQRLPRKIPHWQKVTWPEVCVAWGMKIVGEVDDLFYNVDLADGWKIIATEHPMWTQLVDAQDRQRATIFYKAAFYDRRAHITLTERYAVMIDYERVAPLRAVVVMDGATQKVLREFGTATDDPQDYDKMNKFEKQARLWIDEHYPDYRNPLACW